MEVYETRSRHGHNETIMHGDTAEMRARQRKLSDPKAVSVVSLGGGNGLSTLLSGLKLFVEPESDVPIEIGELSAIVAVSDDGGSSGRLRDELNVPPPGDVRNCMVALSEDSHLLSKLFRHRFEGDGELGGHSFGNLFLAALSEITGDFAEAVRLSSEILASKGHIFPATDANVRIAARLTTGEVVRGETNVGKVGGKIESLFLEPEQCHPMPAAINAIHDADVITVGPGSLYTSLLPPLLVRGVADEINSSKAVKVFICNLMTEPGETDGLSAADHITIMKRYVPELNFDYIILNNRLVSPEQAERYAQEGSEQIGVRGAIDEVFVEGVTVVKTDLLDDRQKVRHDPEKLARAVLSCLPIEELLEPSN